MSPVDFDGKKNILGGALRRTTQTKPSRPAAPPFGTNWGLGFAPTVFLGLGCSVRYTLIMESCLFAPSMLMKVVSAEPSGVEDQTPEQVFRTTVWSDFDHTLSNKWKILAFLAFSLVGRWRYSWRARHPHRVAIADPPARPPHGPGRHTFLSISCAETGVCARFRLQASHLFPHADAGQPCSPACSSRFSFDAGFGLPEGRPMMNDKHLPSTADRPEGRVSYPISRATSNEHPDFCLTMFGLLPQKTFRLAVFPRSLISIDSDGVRVPHRLTVLKTLLQRVRCS